MRIIDDKGKLFGRINIIDFMVILFLVCSAVMFYSAYKVINKKPPLLIPENHIRDDLGQKQKKNYVTLDSLNFTFTKLNPEISKGISIGDKEQDENGEVIGEIISLSNPETFIHKINTGQAEEKIVNDPNLQEIKAVLTLKVEPRGSEVYYKDRRVWKNSPIIFKTDKYEIEAVYTPEEEQPVAQSSQKMSLHKQEIDLLEQKANSLCQRIDALNQKVAPLEQQVKYTEQGIAPLGQERNNEVEPEIEGRKRRSIF